VKKRKPVTKPKQEAQLIHKIVYVKPPDNFQEMLDASDDILIDWLIHKYQKDKRN